MLLNFYSLTFDEFINIELAKKITIKKEISYGYRMES